MTGEIQVKSLRVTLTPEEWRALRVRAAEHDESMAAFVSQLLRAELSRALSARELRRGLKRE